MKKLFPVIIVVVVAMAGYLITRVIERSTGQTKMEVATNQVAETSLVLPQLATGNRHVKFLANGTLMAIPVVVENLEKFLQVIDLRPVSATIAIEGITWEEMCGLGTIACSWDGGIGFWTTQKKIDQVPGETIVNIIFANNPTDDGLSP